MRVLNPVHVLGRFDVDANDGRLSADFRFRPMGDSRI